MRYEGQAGKREVYSSPYSLRIPFTGKAPSLLILRQGSLMARSRGSSSPFYSEFFFLFVDGALEGTKGASEQ